MVVGIFIIAWGAVMLVIGPRLAENMVRRFRTLGSDVDPSYFKIATGVVGVAAIIFGIVKITAALR